MITYNQEDVIRRAMDSILFQKEWGLHKVIIGDDCSIDNTYNILLEYQNLYPEIVFPYQNKKNLGIYANLHNTIQRRVDSDLFVMCSGDDAFCDGFFKSIQSFIEKERINLNNEVGIYSDWKCITPDGKELCGLQKQSLAISGYNLFSLHMRNLIGNRGLMMSKSVIDNYSPPILHGGLRLAEGVYDSQAARTIKFPYYLPQITTIYFSGVGVSTKLSKTDYHTSGNIVRWEYYLKNYITETRDINYAKSQILRSQCLMKPSLKKVFLYLRYSLKGIYPCNLWNVKTVFRNTILLIRSIK